MMKLNTMTVPTTATPIRTGSSFPVSIGAALGRASGLGAVSDGSGSIRVPIVVPAAVAKP